MKILSAAFIFVVFIAITPAYADMPNYDTAAHCNEVASFGGAPSEMIRNGCLQQEQEAYNALKPSWDGLPPAMRSHCDEVARFGGAGSFMILKGCIDQELNAAQQNDQFKFQR